MFFLFFSASEGKTALLFRFSSLEKDESQKSKPEHLSVNDWSEKECYLFSHGVLPLKSYQNNKVIRKVAKTQGCHLEFGKHSGMVSRNKGKIYKGEIQKCIDFSAFLSFSLSFSGFFHMRLDCSSLTK